MEVVLIAEGERNMKELDKAITRVRKMLRKKQIPKKKLSMVSAAAICVVYWELENENEQFKKALYSAVTLLTK